MKKIILSLGVGLFLWAFATHVKVSVDSPMQLVTEQAMAQGTGWPGEVYGYIENERKCCSIYGNPWTSNCGGLNQMICEYFNSYCWVSAQQLCEWIGCANC